ncbi:hypothetical protein BH09PSE2_BH09PSE2_03390 [soil metagenome]
MRGEAGRMVRAEVRFVAPAPALRPYLTAYYTAEITAPEGVPVEDRLHPEWGNLRFVLRGDWALAPLDAGFERSPDPTLFGPTSRSLRIRCTGSGQMFGVGLTGVGWTHLVGSPASDRADGWAPPPSPLDALAAALQPRLAAAASDQECGALLDEALLELSASRPPPPAAALALQGLLLEPEVCTVAQLSERLGVSPRQVERLCREHFGFPPKKLLNRARFMRTLGSVRANPGRPWRELIDVGYCDQSHFVRDFRRFIGLPATAYFAQQRAILAAAADAREKALGEAYQALHPA